MPKKAFERELVYKFIMWPDISEEGIEKKTEPKTKKVEQRKIRRNSQELMRQLNIVRGRSPQSDMETKRTKRETIGGGMREMVPKSFSFSDAFFQYSNGRIFSGSERLYITGTIQKWRIPLLLTHSKNLSVRGPLNKSHGLENELNIQLFNNSNFELIKVVWWRNTTNWRSFPKNNIKESFHTKEKTFKDHC